ncbi:MAG TPA: hypothetical protein VNU68_09005 [Verrucomicrobiae bacterium]|nr:hypothetical protein [Verrucomicrobiae bacterium]
MILKLTKRRTPSSILGLSIQGSRLEGLVLRRSNGSLQVQRTFTASLTLDPLNGDPELVGREIRNHLQQEGIRERHCVVCIPLNWALTLHTPIPELPEEDIGSYLAIEAERGFPYGPEALLVATSRYAAGGERYATQVGIPKSHLQQLEKVLRGAQLRPASFSLGIAMLEPAEADAARGTIALLPGDETIDLQVTCGGGIAGLRSIEGAVETEGTEKEIYADVLAREIRVTLGQLTESHRQSIRTVRLFGGGARGKQCVRELLPRLGSMGLDVQWVEHYGRDAFRSQPPASTPVSAAFSFAAAHLTGKKPALELLPPRTSVLRQFTARFSSRKLAWTAATAAAALLLVGGAIAVQQWELSRLRSEWAGMEQRVHELEDMQQQIRRFRPWFDESFQHLSILRRITEAFPVDGVVSAKTLEIHEPATVTCSGVARDNQAFLRMLDRLRAFKDVDELKVESLRGKTPLQFMLKFRWGQGGPNEN